MVFGVNVRCAGCVAFLLLIFHLKWKLKRVVFYFKTKGASYVQLKYAVLVGGDGDELTDAKGTSAVLFASDIHLYRGRLSYVHCAHCHMELRVRPYHPRRHYRVEPAKQSEFSWSVRPTCSCAWLTVIVAIA